MRPHDRRETLKEEESRTVHVELSPVPPPPEAPRNPTIPWYRRPSVWLAAAAVLAAGGTGAYLATRPSNNRMTEIGTWSPGSVQLP